MWSDAKKRIDDQMRLLQERQQRAQEQERRSKEFGRAMDKVLGAAEGNVVVAFNPLLGLMLLMQRIKEAGLAVEYEKIRRMEKELNELNQLIDERLDFLAKAEEEGIEIDIDKEKDLIQNLMDLRPEAGDKTIRELLNEIVEKIKEENKNDEAVAHEA